MWGAHMAQCVSMAECEVGRGSRIGPGLPVGSHVFLVRTHRGVQELDAGAGKDSEGPFRGRKRNECQLHAVGKGGRWEGRSSRNEPRTFTKSIQVCHGASY